MNTLKNLFKALPAAFRWLFYFLETFFFFIFLTFIRHYIFRQSWKQVWQESRRYCQWGLFAHGIQVHLHNPFHVDLNKDYLVISNHRSWFDQLLIISILKQPMHILSKAEYFKIPLFGKALRIHGGIAVSGKKLPAAEKEKLDRAIRQGDGLIIYPEGTRGQGRDLLPFRSGFYWMAIASKLPVLPIFILGAEDRLSKSNSLLSANPGPVHFVVDTPVYFHQDTGDAEKSIFEKRYREKYEKLFDLYQQKGFDEKNVSQILSPPSS